MNKFKFLNMLLKYRFLIILSLTLLAIYFGISLSIADDTGSVPIPFMGGG